MGVSNMKNFVQKHLWSIGIIDAAYSRWDVTTGKQIFVCSDDKFTELYYAHGCDITAADLMQVGEMAIDDDHPIKSQYDEHKGVKTKEHIIVSRTSYGFDEFVVTSEKRLNRAQISYLRRKMALAAHLFGEREGHAIRGNLKALKERWGSYNDTLPTEDGKFFKFDWLVLTRSEMVALANAHLYQKSLVISDVDVRSVKNKLGRDLTTVEMWHALEKLGVLDGLAGLV
jgi:hypothetical protein